MDFVCELKKINMFKNARSTRSSIPHSLQQFVVKKVIISKVRSEFCVLQKCLMD